MVRQQAKLTQSFPLEERCRPLASLSALNSFHKIGTVPARQQWAWLEALIVHLRPGDALGVTVYENGTTQIDLTCHGDDA